VFGLVAGALVGAFGTAIHRTIWGSFSLFGLDSGVPIGLLIALALTLSAALFIRAAAGFNTFAAFGLGWIVAVQLLAMQHSGGDVLIVDPRENIRWASAGLVWVYLGAGLLVLTALLPPRWFRPIAAVTNKATVPTMPQAPDRASTIPVTVGSGGTADGD
jgi:hypothetical protein